MTMALVRVLLRHGAWLGYPAIGLVLVFVISGSAMHTAGVLDRSVWEGADHAAARVTPLVLGIVATPVLLPMLVAHGATRRRFAAAGAVAGALLAAVAGIYLAAGYLVERVVYGLAGLSQVLNGSHRYGSADQPYLVFIECGLLAMAHLVAGWLIGIGYYGYGGWRGTGLLLPGALVAVAVEYVLGTGWVAGILSTLDREPPGLSLAAAVGLSVVIIAAGLAAGRALLSRVAIRTRRLP